MTHNDAGAPLFKLMDIFFRFRIALFLVLVVAGGMSVTVYMGISNSYIGEATMRIKLSEAQFKIISTRFYNLTSARKFFKHRDRNIKAQGAAIKSRQKLKNTITPLYAYTRDRKLAPTMPNSASNHVALLNFNLSGTSREKILSTLDTLGDFVRNTILGFQLEEYTEPKVAIFRSKLVQFENELLELEFKRRKINDERENVRIQLQDTTLPVGFTWSIPEKGKSQLYLPPQVRMVGVLNRLQNNKNKRMNTERKLAMARANLEFFEAVEQSEADLADADRFIEILSETADAVFRDRLEEPTLIVYNNITSEIREFVSASGGLKFTSPPEVASKPSNRKMKLAAAMIGFSSIFFVGCVLIYLSASYMDYKKEKRS